MVHNVVIALTACQTKQPAFGRSLFSEGLPGAAYYTYALYNRAAQQGELVSPDAISERHWAEEVRDLKPIRVYLHRFNVVIVEKVADGVEEGKYDDADKSRRCPAFRHCE